MDNRELMSFAPKDCQPKVFDTNKEVRQSRKQLAKELKKKPQDLTPIEEEKALNQIGLCSLDFES